MPPHRQSLRRTRVILVAFGLAFAGLTPSALAATGELEESPTSSTQDTDASTALEPTETAAGVTEAASDEGGSSALEASAASEDSSADGGADARGDASNDPAASAGSSRGQDGGSSTGREGVETAAVAEDGERSVGSLVDRSTRDIADRTGSVAEEAATRVVSAAGRAAEAVGEQARPAVKKARETVGEAGAAARPVREKPRAIVGGANDGDRGDAASKPAPGSGRGATAAPVSSGQEPRVGGARRELLPTRHAPGPVRLVPRLVERLLPTPAAAASPPPARRGLASAGLRAREEGHRRHAAPRRVRSKRSPVRLDPLGSAPVAPFEDPARSGGSSVPGGGASSMSPASGGAAALIAAFCFTAPSLLRRLRLSPALVRSVAFVSSLERPG